MHDFNKSGIDELMTQADSLIYWADQFQNYVAMTMCIQIHQEAIKIF